MDTHFAISLLNQDLFCTSSQRMQASGQEWQDEDGIASKGQEFA
jgi:hypothetical protein